MDSKDSNTRLSSSIERVSLDSYECLNSTPEKVNNEDSERESTTSSDYSP